MRRSATAVIGSAAAVGVSLGVAGLAVSAGIIEPRRLVVTSGELVLPRWPVTLDRLRLAVLADVHAGSPFVGIDRVEAVVRRVATLDPELIVLLGDHVADVYGGRKLPIAAVAAALGGLREIAPVVGVLGNHDWYAGGARVRAALDSAGLPTLEEQAVPMPLRGTRLWVAGVGDLWERSPSVATALEMVPTGAPTVLLSHNPDVLPDVPPWVSLTVSGHTHGGQFTVRGRPLHQVSPHTGNRWLRGAYLVDGRLLYVSSGVGTSLWPLRLGVPPEIALLRLRAAGGR